MDNGHFFESLTTLDLEQFCSHVTNEILQKFAHSREFYAFLRSLISYPQKIDHVLHLLKPEELNQLLTRGTKQWDNHFKDVVHCIRSLPEAQQITLLEKWGREHLQRETRSFKQLGYWVDQTKEPISSLSVFTRILDLLGPSYLKSFFQCGIVIPKCSTPEFSQEYFNLLFERLGGEGFLKEKIKEGYDFPVFISWFPGNEKRLANVQKFWNKDKGSSSSNSIFKTSYSEQPGESLNKPRDPFRRA